MNTNCQEPDMDTTIQILENKIIDLTNELYLEKGKIQVYKDLLTYNTNIKLDQQPPKHKQTTSIPQPPNSTPIFIPIQPTQQIPDF